MKGAAAMLDQNQTPQFSNHELEVIKDALFTQEKILAVQARAGRNKAKLRLNDLHVVLQHMRHTPNDATTARTGLWGHVTRALYG